MNSNKAEYPDMGQQFAATRQRIREIEAKALRKLKRNSNDDDPDNGDSNDT